MKVGVIPPLANCRISGRPVSYQDLRRWACTAEDLGFDSVWTYDHLLVRRPGQPQVGVWEGWTVLAAIADATRRVELGTWVTCVGFRNPALLAKMAVTVDEISGGRLILGLGAGNQQPEWEAFGYDFNRRIAAFEEAIQIIGPLIRDGTVDFRGTYHSTVDCALDPRGPRPAGPPILIGAEGPRMLRLAARHADLWTCPYPGGVAGFTEARERLTTACRAEGRDPSTLGLTVGEWIVYPDGSPSGPPTSITGSEEAILDLLREYERVGVDHVMLQAGPDNYDEVLARFGRALGLYRAMSTSV
jgi:probable F420-dependent oxidoreductase